MVGGTVTIGRVNILGLMNAVARSPQRWCQTALTGTKRQAGRQAGRQASSCSVRRNVLGESHGTVSNGRRNLAKSTMGIRS